jgi:hypothetical protein
MRKLILISSFVFSITAAFAQQDSTNIGYWNGYASFTYAKRIPETPNFYYRCVSTGWYSIFCNGHLSSGETIDQIAINYPWYVEKVYY